MPTNKKVIIAIGSFFLVMSIIACSCSSILPTLQTVATQVSQPTSGPLPTIAPLPTTAPLPTIPPEPTVPPEPLVSAAGRWEDPDSDAPYSVTTIEIQNGEYVVVSVTNSGRGNVNELTWSKIVNGVLTWEYCPEGMYCITSELVSFDSNTLTANWYWSDGGNGATTIFRRVP